MISENEIEAAFYAELGRLLRAKRKEKKMSMEDLARAVRTHRNHILRWEQGTAVMSTWMLMRVADALGCTHLSFLPSRSYTWGEKLALDGPAIDPAVKKTVQRERDPGLSEKERMWA